MKTKNIINWSWFLAGIMTLATFTSCEKKFYDEEQYRKEVYIVSGDDNIFGQEYAMGEESEGNISIYVGGTTAIEEDVEVELGLYPTALREYNQRVYGENYADYGRQLDAADYEIQNWKVTIPKGSSKPYVQFPIKVKVSNLMDAEAYYIPLYIKKVSNYMVSPTRNYVLFRIYLKNDYASTKNSTYYTMNALEQVCTESNGTFTPDAPAVSVNSTKLFIPTGQNSIRTMPSALVSSSNTSKIQNIEVTVYPDEVVNVPVLNEGIPTGEYNQYQKVTVKACEPSSDAIVVAELNDEPSYYDPETKKFTLNYRYHSSTEKKWHFMNELLTPLK
ncbi:MAG: DUF4361 domain-containing protein [Prevotellaceae bacterium]|nr:DUF4361 domain-containing protein [Prevotellaceae bacterium]